MATSDSCHFFRKIREAPSLNCAEIALGVYDACGRELLVVKEPDKKEILHVFVKMSNGRYVAPCGYTSLEAERTGYFLEEKNETKELTIEETNITEISENIDCRSRWRKRVKKWALSYLC